MNLVALKHSYGVRIIKLITVTSLLLYSNHGSECEIAVQIIS